MFETDLTDTETKKLLECIKEFEKPYYVEVGVFMGGTFLKVLERTNAYCVGVDLFEDFEIKKGDNTHISGTCTLQQLDLAFKEYDKFKKRYCLFKDKSTNILSQILWDMDEVECKYDGQVVFIDGNHTFKACLQDCILALTNVIKNGYLILHNASNTFEPDTWYIAKDGGPYKVTEFLKEHANVLNITYQGTFDRSAVFKV